MGLVQNLEKNSGRNKRDGLKLEWLESVKTVQIQEKKYFGNKN